MVTPAEVLAVFEERMAARPDLGLLNRAANMVLESRNPFDPSRRRRPKMEAVIFGSLAGIVIGCLAFFNLVAPRL